MFRLFRSWPATSNATFGRASKFAPTTPIGIRRSEIWRPFSSVLDVISRSSGSIPRYGLDLLREGVDACAVEAQAVEHPLVEPASGGFDVGFVGREDLVRSRPNERRRLAQRSCDGLVAQLRNRTSRIEGLLLDKPAQIAGHVAPASARRASGASGAGRPSVSTWTTVWRPRMQTSSSRRISQP